MNPVPPTPPPSQPPTKTFSLHDFSEDPDFCMNLARGISVLRVFSLAECALGNKEICERTGLPKATVSRLTYTLTLLGCLVHDKVAQKYRLGWGMLPMCHPLLASMPVRQAAKSLMEDLASQTGCTVNMGIRDRTHVVYVESVRGDAANKHAPDIGSHAPLLAGSIGRALVLGRPLPERTAILNYLKVQDPIPYETYWPIWEADLKRFNDYGYCQARGDWHKDVHGIAVPVQVPLRETPVSISCTLTGPDEASELLKHKALSALKEMVRELELVLGTR
jgi:DNA-binding IclR family transcriptional regulator